MGTVLRPAPGFDRPLALLEACHDRIESRCTLLLRLVDHLEQQGMDDDARLAARQVLSYFDDAGVKHHQDEEQDLFPALLAVAGPEQAMLDRLIDELREDHRRMEALWGELREPLKAIRTGAASALDRELARRFQALYLQHIEREERDLLPVAARRLSAEQIRCLGASMAARRGLTLAPAR
ncbi:hemerythrin domain-containing protein [Pelomicrobium methylotrophicum]|uniref:Hemerythrin domain-containing protein n=1 Tax=Pelomicrobium methylotrophicum TaxID=2602750 RepID=A0A5C7EU51_9PROT|nr:hemerythrin domain-containing protein [Pelomicrobium methylotrophicum]TXF11738.1 hemerythrin domain-containing protein [Pelomicrobium methylotrophicum]